MRPILFSLLGRPIAAAPAFAGLAALASYLHFERRKKELALSDEDFWLVIASLAAGVVAGALLFYALLYGGGPINNANVLLTRRALPGGSFLGAYAGAIAFAALCCRWRKLPFAPVGDVLGAAAPLGLAVMRVGCLLHGCCYGRPTELPWALALHGARVHPTQLYEALGSLAIFLYVDRRRGRGALWASVGLYAALRFAVDFVRAGDPGLGAALGLTMAQWLAAAVMLCAAAARARRRA